MLVPLTTRRGFPLSSPASKVNPSWQLHLRSLYLTLGPLPRPAQLFLVVNIWEDQGGVGGLGWLQRGQVREKGAGGNWSWSPPKRVGWTGGLPQRWGCRRGEDVLGPSGGPWLFPPWSWGRPQARGPRSLTLTTVSAGPTAVHRPRVGLGSCVREGTVGSGSERGQVLWYPLLCGRVRA